MSFICYLQPSFGFIQPSSLILHPFNTMTFYPHFQRSFSGGGFISPQYLFNTGNADAIADALGIQTDVSPPTVCSVSIVTDLADGRIKPHQGVKPQDVGVLQPGKQYQLSPDPMPTPQSILDGSYLHHHRDVVVIVPRLPKHRGSPSLSSIVFSVDGKPGPYVSDLVHDRVAVDNASDMVFRDRIWKQTSLTIDVSLFLFTCVSSLTDSYQWPGVSMPAEYISCVDKENGHLTRMQVANMVALRVHNVIMIGRNGSAFVCRYTFMKSLEAKRAWLLEMGSPNNQRRHQSLGLEKDRLSGRKTYGHQLLQEDLDSCSCRISD